MWKDPYFIAFSKADTYWILFLTQKVQNVFEKFPFLGKILGEKFQNLINVEDQIRTWRVSNSQQINRRGSTFIWYCRVCSCRCFNLPIFLRISFRMNRFLQLQMTSKSTAKLTRYMNVESVVCCCCKANALKTMNNYNMFTKYT